MIEVNRKELLDTLEKISAGLSTNEVAIQSDCFVFYKNKVFTFNDDVTCNIKSPIKQEFAIKASPLLAILRKLKDESVKVGIIENDLIIKHKKRKAGIRIEKEIELPIKTIEKPKEWKKLPKEFIEAVSIVQNCASNEDSTFELTCIHLNPKYIEACDSQQLARYKMRLQIKQDVLIRRDSLKCVLPLKVSEFCETKSWIHFKNENNLIISCRKYLEDYRDMSKIMNFKGTPITLPKSIKEASERAEVFSVDSPNNTLLIKLQKGKLQIKGQGDTGWYKETKKVKYKGPDITFTISPSLLTNLLKRNNHCEITDGKMKISGDNYTYVTVLGISE